MVKTIRHRPVLNGDRGAVAVEFALILPLLILLILLMIDFGRLFFIQISLNSASREAVRGSSLAMSASMVESLAVKSAPGVAALASLSDLENLRVILTPCSTSASGESTSVEVHATFKWITPVKLVQFFDTNSTWIDPSGLGMDVFGRGEMFCSES